MATSPWLPANSPHPSPVLPPLNRPFATLINFTTPKSDKPAQNTYFCNMNTSNAEIITHQWFARKWKPRPADGHKGTFGHLLLIAGHEGMIGAAVLAARSALRSGVGKVTVHIPRCGRDVLQVAVPEAVLQVDESSESCFAHSAQSPVGTRDSRDAAPAHSRCRRPESPGNRLPIALFGSPSQPTHSPPRRDATPMPGFGSAVRRACRFAGRRTHAVRFTPTQPVAQRSHSSPLHSGRQTARGRGGRQ